MSEEIKFSSDEAERAASDADKINENIDNILQGLQTVEESISTNWKGDAAESFRNNMPDQIQKIKNLQAALTDISKNLRNNSYTMTEQDQNCANAWT